MSIKAYVGRMGSGKTYEVVSSVIVPALARGRRAVSNIAGLDYDEIVAYLVERGTSADKIGRLVQVSHDEVQKPEFWRTDKDEQQRIEAFIQPGDLVALDEIWRFWEGFGTRNMPERVMNFYRMHRHFTHPQTGVCCDVAIITQDVMDISRKVRAVIEETYYMEKHTAIGSTKRYRVDVFQGGKKGRNPLLQLQRAYDPAVFPLYASHSQKKEGDADAKEENIDGRGNILNSPIFRFGLPAAFCLMLISGWGMYRFFNPKPKEEPQATASAQHQPATNDAAQVPQPASNVPEISQEWRVVGWYQQGGSITATLQNASGKMRSLPNPPSYKLSAAGLEVMLPEGGFATPWTAFNKNTGLP